MTMPRTSQQPKGETFNFRIDPTLKAAFTAAAEAEAKPAAQVLRDFMRSYVKQTARRAFEAEAHRQSLAIAARSRDHISLGELEGLADEDSFADEWKA
jgi:hypothetical protein